MSLPARVRKLEAAAPAEPRFDFAPVLADDRTRAILAEVPALMDRMGLKAVRAELRRRLAGVWADGAA